MVVLGLTTRSFSSREQAFIMDEELHDAKESFELWMSIFGVESWDKMLIGKTVFWNRKYGGSVAFFGIN